MWCDMYVIYPSIHPLTPVMRHGSIDDMLLIGCLMNMKICFFPLANYASMYTFCFVMCGVVNGLDCCSHSHLYSLTSF